MEELSQRLMKEQVARLATAIEQKVVEDSLPRENVDDLLSRLESLGLVKFGKLRSHFLLHDKTYCPAEQYAPGLIADLLLALAMISRVSGAVGSIAEDGIIEFMRDGRPLSSYIVSSGLGFRSRWAIEAAVKPTLKRYRSRPVQPCGVIVGGTSDPFPTTLAPPKDIVRGNEAEDVVAGPAVFKMFHINDLRADISRINMVVP
jgi:hypothetical protein